jgi:hypothetical protein
MMNISFKDVNSDDIKLDKIIQKIEMGLIKIPPFQRKFVWSQNQILELLDSIFNNYPIGSLLLWNTKEDLPSTRNIGGFKLPLREKEFPVDYVLDGQQRLTSIYGCLCQNTDQEVTDYSPNPDLFNVYFDLCQKKFLTYSVNSGESITIPVRLLFDNSKFVKEIMKYSTDTELIDTATNLQSVFQNYEIPIVTVKGREKSEVGTIFERINNTGTELSTLDLMIAWTWTGDYHLKEEIDEIVDSLQNKGFGDIKDKIILQSLGAIIKKTTVTKDILSMSPDEVRNTTENLKNSLELAIDFIATQFKIQTDDFLPNPHQIVPLAYCFSKSNHLSSNQSNAIKKWFWRTSFSNRYSDSTDQKMNEDIVFFDKVLNNDFKDIDKYKTSITVDFFKKQTLTKSNPFVRAYLLLLAQFNPLDLTNGNLIDVNFALSSFNRKEYHHIFPKNFLEKEKRLKLQQVNVLSNFCFLPANSNKKILNKAPSDYFKSIIPANIKDRIFDSCLIPKNPKIYETNNYEIFLNERTDIIFDRIKQLSEE